ncbi:MAG: amino acid ABC transporter ATP-binding protein, partial [Clostridia bacterium]|nr:amino acid ABC transporter ATP-binding protein [Clostridia bacterium]
LKGIDLTVDKGDVVAILGPSGSGKTTFLRCINFLERADAGEMVFDGETFDLAAVRRRDVARIRRKTAFVFQNYNLFLNKTVLDNVTLGLTAVRNLPRAEATDRAMDALIRVGMADKVQSYPSQLSGGQQQRVSIGRALYSHPAVLLCDEPTGNLDRKTGEEIVGLLKESNRSQKQTLILITHDEALAMQADRILYLEDGKIVKNEVLRHQV